jgi:hypothetical protein
MRRLTPLLPLLAVGCGAATPPPPPAEVAQPTLVVPDQPESAPAAPKPADPPAVVLPSDLGGKAVGRVIHSTPTLPADPITTAPKPRKYEPDPSELSQPNGVVMRPSSPALQSKPPLPAPPPDRPPTDLGSAAAVNPGDVKLADRPRIQASGPNNPKAADVPMTGWRQPDRVSLDDPTVDPTAARLTFTTFPQPVNWLPHLPLRIPDPFEFQEQLKGKTGRDAEFATTPVVVNPERK